MLIVLVDGTLPTTCAIQVQVSVEYGLQTYITISILATELPLLDKVNTPTAIPTSQSWVSTVTYTEILAQNKHQIPWDPFLDVGLVTSSNIIDYRQDIRMLIAKNYNAHILDVGKPITPQNASEVFQQYSLLVMDETKALILDTEVPMYVAFDATGFIGTIHPPSQQTLAGLSEKTQVKGGKVVQWQLRDDYSCMHTI
eukprot:4262205-Ditylum_brightwellii.AAC.2